MIIYVYLWDRLYAIQKRKNMIRLKQCLILCLLSWGAAAHAESAQPFVPEMDR